MVSGDVVDGGSVRVVDVDVDAEGVAVEVETVESGGSPADTEGEQAARKRSAAPAAPARLSDQKEPPSPPDRRRELTKPPQCLVALRTLPNGFLARRVVFHRTSITLT